MNVPGIVQSALDGEEIAARVSLGGEDELFITPSSTLVYRAEGLLSDESVDEYPHDADQLTLSAGRRKTTFTLEYPLEGTREFSVPASKTDDVLHPVLAGVLNGNDITDSGETVAQTYRFSELTLIITSDRLVKHIGSAVWDEDYEEYAFEDVTNLAFEDGSVATQIVLTVDGRPQRIKAPNDEANDLRERLKRALFAYHDVDSLAELNELVGAEETGDEAERADASMDFGDGVDPLDANPPEIAEREREGEGSEEGQRQEQTQAQNRGQSATPESTDQTTHPSNTTEEQPAQADTRETDTAQTASQIDQSSTESAVADTEPILDGNEAQQDEFGTPEGTSVGAGAGTGIGAGSSEADPGPDPEVLERIENLEDAVDRQNDLIEQQQQTIEKLITELRQGR